MDSERRRQLIRGRLSDGRLPSNGVARVWGGVGRGEVCDGCEKTITVVDFIFGGASTSAGQPGIQMHVECFRIWDDERVGFTRAPESMTLADKIRERIAAGKLPTHAAWKRWGGRGNGARCDACDVPITELQYEFDSVDGRVFRFHRPCILAWDEIRVEAR